MTAVRIREKVILHRSLSLRRALCLRGDQVASLAGRRKADSSEIKVRMVMAKKPGEMKREAAAAAVSRKLGRLVLRCQRSRLVS